ncbi:MAG: hypothetical protein PHV77_05945 [Candidatus Omnitrophica bacterium]|nr:hypothetical protein [Candidatus Omnitrophota bacterium]
MRRYNIGINWNSLDDCYFAKALKKICREKKLIFLWVHDGVAKKILKKLYEHELRIDALIDTDATYNDPDDIYARVCYAVKDSGGIVINDPDNTQFAINKAVMYYKLLYLGFSTPYTIVIRKWHPKKVLLNREQKARLGAPFIIKPAQGYAQKGIIRQANSTPYCIAKARAFDPDDDFLLQKKVTPVSINGKRCWFRVFRIFDYILPCWWDDTLSRYEHMSEYEFKEYGLSALFDITSGLAKATGMVWFSTEIALLGPQGGKPEYTVIDYVNDQCDMTPISQIPSGIPDHVVDFTAAVLMKNVLELIKGRRGARQGFKLYFR